MKALLRTLKGVSSLGLDSSSWDLDGERCSEVRAACSYCAYVQSDVSGAARTEGCWDCEWWCRTGCWEQSATESLGSLLKVPSDPCLKVPYKMLFILQWESQALDHSGLVGR